MDRKLTDMQKEMYKRNNPDSGEEDIRMYEMHRIKNKSAISIAHDVGYSEATVYRRVKRVESFLEQQQFYHDFSTLEYLHPRYVILMGYKTKIVCLITQMAIALNYQNNINYIDQYYYNVLMKDTPSIKNRKRELEDELKKVYWENMNTNKKILIFRSIRIERNSIQFDFTEDMEEQITIMKLVKKLGLYD